MVNNSKGKFTPAQQATLTTLLYSDIFNFPLTREELWRFLITEKKITRSSFENSLKTIQEYISYKDGYYCLRYQERVIVHRIKNLQEVAKKLQRARSVATKLSAIPSILFIGLTGGLAVGNVKAKDDIDLVIIVEKNTLFVSRLLILTVLQTLGVRRSRNQKNTADTICVNLLFDETSLSWFANFQDIYTAREIAQISPLFERQNTYQRFLSANSWIKQFLPNFYYSKVFSTIERHHGKRGTSAFRIKRFWTSQNDNLILKLISNLITNPVAENLLCILQTSLMKPHQTRETVTKNVLAFHPIDYRLKTLKQLRLKMRQLGLLTKF